MGKSQGVLIPTSGILTSARAMPNPDCTGQGLLEPGVIDFGRLGRREVEGRFDAGSMASDRGVMLLSAADRKIGLTAPAVGAAPQSTRQRPLVCAPPARTRTHRQ